MSTTRELRLVSWNVNGLRAVMKKDPSFTDVVEATGADVFAIQETKLQEGQIELDLCPATTRPGATPSARATPARPCSAARSRCR